VILIVCAAGAIPESVLRRSNGRLYSPVRPSCWDSSAGAAATSSCSLLLGPRQIQIGAAIAVQVLNGCSPTYAPALPGW